MCCEILGGCSSFRTWKKSCNSTLKICEFYVSRGLGYCIKGVDERKATDGKKKKKNLQKLERLVSRRPVGVVTWTRGVGVATWSRGRDVAEMELG